MSETKVVISGVRFSYAHVFEAKAIGNGEPKYSVSVLVPKKNKEALAKIKAAIEAAAEEGKGKWGGKIPKMLKTPLRDGDEEKEDDDNYAGMMFFNASSKRKPEIVDQDFNEIIDRDEFYSGCWGKVSINFYPFDFEGKKGVAAGLNNLMKTKDDDKLGGGASSASEDFGNE